MEEKITSNWVHLDKSTPQAVDVDPILSSWVVIPCDLNDVDCFFQTDDDDVVYSSYLSWKDSLKDYLFETFFKLGLR